MKMCTFPTVGLNRFFFFFLRLEKNIIQNLFAVRGCERVRAPHIQIKLIPE